MHKDSWIALVLAPFFWAVLRWLSSAICRSVDKHREREGSDPRSLRSRALRLLTHKWGG